MSERPPPKWTSSRVARLQEQQPAKGTTPQRSSNGTNSSRWAPAASSSGLASDVRSRAICHVDTSDASSWRVNANALGSTQGPGGSRWAAQVPSAQPSKNNPKDSTRHYTYTAESRPFGQLSKPNGLKTRDASKPLGGKTLDRMALLASPSRGLDEGNSLSADLLAQGSMDLTTPKVQQEFRIYISEQISTKVLPVLQNPRDLSVLDDGTYLPGPSLSTKRSRAEEELQQVVLMVRKLREAVVASHRVDTFAVDVYELSVWLSLLCMDVPQLSASLPILILQLYPQVSLSSEPELRAVRDIGPLQKSIGHGELALASARRGHGRDKMASLLLLQTLCLSGKAARLGQYASGPSAQASDRSSSTAALREYVGLRARMEALYPGAQDELLLCDTVYNAVRDSNPFILQQLLHSNGDAKLDLWQRIVLLQLLPTLRMRAWAIARKAYMYLPVSHKVARAATTDLGQSATESTSASTSAYLISLLLLDDQTLLPSFEEVQRHGSVGPTPTNERTFSTRSGSVKATQETPESWDAEEDDIDNLAGQLATARLGSSPSSDLTMSERRLQHFLASELCAGDAKSLSTRIMPIREGYAVKIR
ncbi:hypothetical protein BCV70DRAFT_202554 [Testicularia cyperi]|uniref:Uncharacterized protein n=1 Tax=Testicularia cyperi TaxID=1882483 RepID=A0A317XKG5_9BASI|nr:hypothetical protein BCV70DRAFT_202554 [Testicularia cyperi]